MIVSSLYQTWVNMLRRCSNPLDKSYPDYGGRGITVCESWKTFDNFRKDMGDRPKCLFLERKDNDLGYSKENCTWTTRSEQNRNTRVRKDNLLGIKGVTKHCKGYRARGHLFGNMYQLYSGPSLEEAVAARQAWEESLKE